MPDIIVGLSAVACVAGFVLEWRRLGNDSRLQAIEARLSALESSHAFGQQVADRVVALEGSMERLRRNL